MGLAEVRRGEQPRLPHIFSSFSRLSMIEDTPTPRLDPAVESILPHSCHQHRVLLTAERDPLQRRPLRVGVVFSGGQAAGGHNVITGLFDALLRFHPSARLFGFLNGPAGVVKGEAIELTAAQLAPYRNQGGFDLIGSGRTKIETPEQFLSAKQVVEKLQLDGLVIIGGDDSNTNAALLAEYFLAEGCVCHVIGVPKTIDGDLRSEDVELPFGFDTACKTYSEFIGNIARDALSAKKYTFFIKLMGRSASHIALECALQTHANLTLIGEELAERKVTLSQVVDEIADLIIRRADAGKNYGVVLIPEGILEFIPECKTLINELNTLLVGQNPEEAIKQLTPASAACFAGMPSLIQRQLLMDRDPHGNVQVSKIESERLLLEMTEVVLKRRSFKGKFSGQPLFCGYEGRSGLPSLFDANYCYALGYMAAFLLQAGLTGYMAFVRGLARPVEEWEGGGLPLASLIHLEQRKGAAKPVIAKAMVDLSGPAFAAFSASRDRWTIEDDYVYPGPIQFFGPSEITDSVPISLMLSQGKRNKEVVAVGSVQT